MQVGAQFYTLRESCKTPEDLENSLKRVHEMGIRVVQLSGVCPYDPAWMRDILKKYDLVCGLTHVNPNMLAENTEKMFEDHLIFGCPYIGIGGTPAEYHGSVEGIKAFADKFLPVAEKIHEMGGKLFYHNHSYEFNIYNGKTELEWICEFFPKELLGFTLDTYWVQHGGGDPVRWIHKLAGRLECVHLKDMASVKNDPIMMPVYEGNMNFDAILPACLDVGTKYAFIEQDNCNGEDPFKCMKTSFDNVMTRFPMCR